MFHIFITKLNEDTIYINRCKVKMSLHLYSFVYNKPNLVNAQTGKYTTCLLHTKYEN